MLTFTFGSGWTPGAPSTATATPMAKQGWQMATAGWRHRTTPFCDFSCQNFGHPRVIRDPGLVSSSLWKNNCEEIKFPNGFFPDFVWFPQEFLWKLLVSLIKSWGDYIICRKILIPSRNFPEENPGCLKVELFFEHEHLSVSRTVLSDSHMSGWEFSAKTVTGKDEQI